MGFYFVGACGFLGNHFPRLCYFCSLAFKVARVARSPNDSFWWPERHYLQDTSSWGWGWDGGSGSEGLCSSLQNSLL